MTFTKLRDEMVEAAEKALKEGHGFSRKASEDV
jgi:hypothetical protein